MNMFSAKILFILIASTFFLQCTCQKQIRGLPERDYPTYYAIPQTSFSCSDQSYNPGFYADTETRCQVFHYCYEHRQESFLCPIGTIFNQPIMACDYWYSSNCSMAPSYYHFNAHKRTEDHIDEAENPRDWQSKNVFDKMTHLYEINEAPESPVMKNDADVPTTELLGRDVVESYETLIENNNETDYNKYSYDNQFNMIDEAHPEVVKYEVGGSNALNTRESSENEQPYETDNMEDFIFSEDGMLHHPRQSEDIYQMYPTDMNFDPGHSGYAEVPSNGYFNYDLNGDLDPQSDFQISDVVLQNRNEYIPSDYVRPSNRKPVIVISDAEPEMIQLPVVKRKRKPISITSTVSTNAEGESSYELNYTSDIYKEAAVSVTDQGLEGKTSEEFASDESKSHLNDELRDPQLFYEVHEEFNDENSSKLHQTDNLSIIYDSSNEKEIRSAFVPSNIDEEISSNVFGSGSNIFRIESSSVFPGESSEMSAEDETFDSDQFLGSGFMKNIDQSHLSDGSSFSEDQDIISDSEDAEINDTGKSSMLPMNLFDSSEGSGISAQEAAFLPFGKLSPVETNDGEELLPDGSGGSNEFNLPHELQQPSDDFQDASNMKVQDIDGSLYDFSDSESNSNYEFEDSSGFSSKNVDYVVTENFEDSSYKMIDELVNNKGSLHYQDSIHLENNYEKLPDEYEAVSLSHIPEYIVDGSDSPSQSSIDDLKYLEVMPQNPSPNLFEVSDEKWNPGSIRDETHGVEMIPPKPDVGEVETHEDLDEFQSLISDTLDNQEQSADIEPSGINLELLDAEQRAEEPSNADDLGQVESEMHLPEQNLETFVSGKEADPFSPLLAESDKILINGPEGKRKFSKVSPVMPKNAKASPAMGKDLKKVSRGKRFSDNLQTFNPANKDNLIVPSRETFRETMFTNIPSAFLKMKHSALRPYFFNYGLKNSGFNPRTGDSFESSKFSKLTSLGKRLLGAKFNKVKNYIDSYRYD